MSGDGNDTVEACLERIRAAWDAGDAAGFAEEFTENASYIVYFGELLDGRDEIERMHVEPLGRGTRMRMEMLSKRHLSDEVAVVVTAGGVGLEAEIRLDKMQTLMMVRRDGRWRCCAFQNTERGARAKERGKRE